MRSAPILLAPTVLVTMAALSCSSHTPSETDTKPPPAVGLKLTAPNGLLTNLDTVLLFVSPATQDRSCDTNTGLVGSTPRTSGASGLIGQDDPNNQEMKTISLGTSQMDGTPCPDGSLFCSDSMELERHADRPMVFQAVGVRDDKPVAVGCFQGPVDTDPYRVNLRLVRYVAPTTCGDRILAPTEQCEAPIDTPSDADSMCTASCTTRDVLLTLDHNGPWHKTVLAGPKGSKHRVALAWSHSPGAAQPNPLHIVFEDTNPGENTANGNPEINYRQLNQDAYSITWPALLGAQIHLPYAPLVAEGFDTRPSSQTSADIAAIGSSSFAVVYEDNRNCGEGESNISLTMLSNDLTEAQPDRLDTNVTGKKMAHHPAIAQGPTGDALVVWEDSLAKRIKGRFWAPFGWLSETDKVIGEQQGSSPDVAGGPSGWVIVWRGASSQDDDGILLRHIAVDGKMSKIESVNERMPGVQDQPSVAMLPDGRFAVVWHEGGGIFIQRFDAQGVKIPGDQTNPLNDASAFGEGIFPDIAASNLHGGFYAVVWGTSEGRIRGIFLSPQQGTLTNYVDGQPGPFSVSAPTVDGQRQRPAVAIGGRGHVAVAWEDSSDQNSGIFLRRLPLPLRD